MFRVNDEELHSLKKEEVDFDPSKTEILKVDLKVNNIEAFPRSVAWIIDDVDERIQDALGMNQLSSLEI